MAPQHVYQCLTKRPGRMREYIMGARNRVAALVYNVKHGQRTDLDIKRAFRDRFGRADLEDSETPWARSQAGRRIPRGSEAQSMQAGSRGVSKQTGLLAGDDDAQWGKDCDGSPSNRVVLFQRPDHGRIDDQSQEWGKERQPPGKPRAGNDVRATPPRPGSPQGQPQSSDWEQAPQNEIERKRCDRHSPPESRRDASEDNSEPLCHEPESNIGDLPSENLDAHLTWPLPNVWAGTSVEDCVVAYERILPLLLTPAAVRWISAEPLLGPIDLSPYFIRNLPDDASVWQQATGLDWVVCGGESGTGHRPMEPDWARFMSDQCRAAGVPFFMKQMAGKAEIPPDLMIREYPTEENQ